MTKADLLLHQDVFGRLGSLIISIVGTQSTDQIYFLPLPIFEMKTFSWSTFATVLLVIITGTSLSIAPSPTAATTSDSTKFAIARPFSATDVEKLAASFDEWEIYPPCAADEDENMLTGARADLFLVYSQSIDLSPEAQEAVSAVEEAFQRTNGWNGCFGQIRTLSAGIEPKYDIYDPSAQGNNTLWVNGPNRQFERTIRLIQTEKYEAVYLMEGDSVPVADAWLDSLLSDVEIHRPFDILGSIFKGDKWDPFLGSLDKALVQHINGNAIYNLTESSLLPTIVEELEGEASGSIPYDLRISQLSLINNYTGIKRTETIANFASTNILPRHIPPNAVIVHGAKMLEPWNGVSGTGDDLTLVVTAWDDPDASFLLSNLEDGAHPFSNILVMIPHGSNTPVLEIELPIPVTFYHRQDDEYDYMDLCTATDSVSTGYFMLTNSYHRIRPNTSPMMTNDGRLVIPFAPATEEYCFKYPSCVKNLEHAQSFSRDYEKVIQDSDMLYETKYVQEMCSVWKEVFGTNGRRLLSGTAIPGSTTDGSVVHSSSSLDPATPGAMAYAAFLDSRGVADEKITFSDATQYGTRPIFVRIPSRSASPGHRLLTNDGSTNSTSTGCVVEVTETACLDSSFDCEWRSLFDSCHEKPSSESGSTGFHNLSMNLIGVGTLSEEEMLIWQDSTSSFVSSFYDLDESDVETVIISQTVAGSSPTRRFLAGATNAIKYKQRFVTESAATKVAESIEASGASLAESLSSPFDSSVDVASYIALLQENAEDALAVNAFAAIESITGVELTGGPDNLEQPNGGGDGFEPGTPTSRERRAGFIGMIAGIAGGAVIIVVAVALFLQRRRGHYDSTPVFEVDESIGTMDVVHDFTGGYRHGQSSSRGDVYNRRGDIVPVSPTEFDL